MQKPQTSYQEHTALSTPVSNNFGLTDRNRLMSNLYSKHIGVWDAMTLAADNRAKKEEAEKKLKIKRQQAELMAYYNN